MSHKIRTQVSDNSNHLHYFDDCADMNVLVQNNALNGKLHIVSNIVK